MAEIHARRMAAQVDGDFVVFIIGMRINKPWKIHKWLPVFLAMPRMLKELAKNPESGYLGHEQFLGALVQYWRSFDHLERYARDHNQEHWLVWVAFNKRVGLSRGDVGIWHETYRIAAGQHEAIYSGMPAFGLGKVGRLAPATGARESARGRMSPAATSPA
jgi:Monooxygenase af470-like